MKREPQYAVAYAYVRRMPAGCTQAELARFAMLSMAQARKALEALRSMGYIHDKGGYWRPVDPARELEGVAYPDAVVAA